MELPKPGDKIYIGSSFHISRGSDDVRGGLATIDEVQLCDHLPPDHVNYCMVTIEEVPGVAYNITHLRANQEKWKLQFGDSAAYPDPDIDTPWIQSGDIVDGKKYDGPPIW